MALDFHRLPPEASVPDKRPSPLVWMIVFFVIVLSGVFSVLLFWPADVPTRTPWYWICVAVYPPGVAAFVVLRRFGFFEDRRLDAIAHNDARQQYVTEQFERESRPLAILGAAYRFSSDAAEDGFDRILDGTAKIVSRAIAKPDTPPMKARWFEAPSTDENDAPFTTDKQRQQNVLAWAFDALIAQLDATLQRLPEDLPLVIHITLTDVLKTDETQIEAAQNSWREAWAKSGLRPRAIQASRDADVMAIDAWLDQVNLDCEHEVRLFVMVRLSPIIGSIPQDGSAEVASALLLAPLTMQQKFRLAPIAWLHRPTGAVGTSYPPVNTRLDRALHWGDIQPEGVTRIWQSGLTGGAANAVNAALVQAGITQSPTVLDDLVGHAGEVAPWLGLACASMATAQDRAAQLVVTTNKNEPCFCVVRGSEIRREPSG